MIQHKAVLDNNPNQFHVYMALGKIQQITQDTMLQSKQITQFLPDKAPILGLQPHPTPSPTRFPQLKINELSLNTDSSRGSKVRTIANLQ